MNLFGESLPSGSALRDIIIFIIIIIINEYD